MLLVQEAVGSEEIRPQRERITRNALGGVACSKVTLLEEGSTTKPNTRTTHLFTKGKGTATLPFAKNSDHRRPSTVRGGWLTRKACFISLKNSRKPSYEAALRVGYLLITLEGETAHSRQGLREPAP